MKGILSIFSAVLIFFLFSCAPVLRQDLMSSGSTAVPMSRIKETPLLYAGKLFILGGLIIKTKSTAAGSLIEAVYIPVDSSGYLKGKEYAQGRFLALYPKEMGFLDPEIYRKGREITLAGEFVELRAGRIDEADYTYPVFEIKQIYLWKEEKDYIPPPYPPYYSPYPYPYWWNDPYWRTRPHFYPPHWW